MSQAFCEYPAVAVVAPITHSDTEGVEDELLEAERVIDSMGSLPSD